MNNMADVLLELRDIVTEKVRAVIVRRFGVMLSNQFRYKGGDAYTHWMSHGLPRFIRECEVVDDPTPEDLAIAPTELAAFCKRWEQVTAFRTGPEGKWRTVSMDMSSLRLSMLTELREVAAGETTVEKLNADLTSE